LAIWGIDKSLLPLLGMPLSGTGFLKDILEDNMTRKPATGRNRLNTLDSDEKGVYPN